MAPGKFWDASVHYSELTGQSLCFREVTRDCVIQYHRHPLHVYEVEVTDKRGLPCKNSICPKAHHRAHPYEDEGTWSSAVCCSPFILAIGGGHPKPDCWIILHYLLFVAHLVARVQMTADNSKICINRSINNDEFCIHSACLYHTICCCKLISHVCRVKYHKLAAWRSYIRMCSCMCARMFITITIQYNNKHRNLRADENTALCQLTTSSCSRHKSPLSAAYSICTQTPSAHTSASSARATNTSVTTSRMPGSLWDCACIFRGAVS